VQVYITERAAFLFRQYVKHNLYDRLSTRPFLTLVEKKWLAFQLVCAVNELHSLGIVHGDMKTENVLVNSFLWVSLADLASYKPVYLSKNHPSADFNYYFDISRRRTCCLAPERLGHLTAQQMPSSSSSSNINRGRPSGGVENFATADTAMYNEMKPPDPNDFQPSMDIFSLGCVIAELFMERPLFDFARLLAYRERKYDPVGELTTEIAPQCRHILDMVLNMLSLNSDERLSAAAHLQEQSEKAFPGYFVVLKNYVSRFISVGLMPDDIVVKLKSDLPLLLRSFSSSVYSAETLPTLPMPSTTDNTSSPNKNSNEYVTS
jgi:phosphoinositide-3-kinase regulatory subunit 4